MSISSAMNAGVAGLNANANRLASISDNIANSGTVGYKRMVTEFESMVITPENNAGSYAAGGVRTGSFRMIDERGSLTSSNNALDLAIAGRGMLAVTREATAEGEAPSSMLMTRTGHFRPDKDGTVRTNAGLVLLGWPADKDQKIQMNSRDTIDGLRPVVIKADQEPGKPTTEVTLAVNLPASATSPGAKAEPYSSSITYFNNLGKGEKLLTTFTPVAGTGKASNEWKLEIKDSAQSDKVIAAYTLVFEDGATDSGTLKSVTPATGYNATTGTLSLTTASGPLQMKIGRKGDAGALTQYEGKFDPTKITKNGAPSGTLKSLAVDDQGYLKASYDNGTIRTLYQLPVVDVKNYNGLNSHDNQTFSISMQSGDFFLRDAGTGPVGTIEGFAIEESATDVAHELTSLIQTQRAYSSNAKVIQTVDEMLQETTNIKR